jgi:sugar phosphate permease
MGGFAPVWTALNNWFVRKKGRAMGTGMAAQSLGGLLIAPVLAVLIATMKLHVTISVSSEFA